MSSPSGPRLRQELRGHQFFTLAFGAIIGVGWVVVLGEWLAQAGPLGAAMAMMGGGLIMALVGLCYGEIAAMFPVAGGEVAYTYEIYGAKTCFATGWSLALAYIAVTAFEAVSVGWVADALIPGHAGATLYVIGNAPVQAGALSLALGGMAVLTVVNYRGVGPTAHLQDLLTYGLICLSAVFIAAGSLWGNLENLTPLFRRGDARSVASGILSVFVTAPFWYAGFNVIPQLMEEKAPTTSLKLVARLILLSIGLAAVFYVFVILSCSMLMPWEDLLRFNVPAAAAFEVALNSTTFAKIVLTAALLGLLTTWNPVFMAASRVLFALGRAHMIGPIFGRLHPASGSPSTAILFVASAASLGVLFGRDAIIPIINVASTCLAFAFLLVCWGVIRLRRTSPHHRRPFSVPGGARTAGLAVAGCAGMLALSLYQPLAHPHRFIPLELVVLAAWVILGAAFWRVARGIRGGVDEDERRRLILGAGWAHANHRDS